MLELPNVMEVINNHRTIRKYKKSPIPSEHIELLMKAGIRAPSSVNLQAYSILRIVDPGIRKALYEVAGQQSHILEAAEFWIFVADVRRAAKAMEKLGFTPAEPNLYMFYVSTIDATIAAQNIVLAAESLGYGTCYIGAIQNDPCKVSEILGLPKGVYPLFGLTIGVPDEWPEKRPRLSKEALFFVDQYPKEELAAEEAMKAYEASGAIDSFIRRFKRYYSAGGRYEARNKLICHCLEKQGFVVEK